MLYAVGQTAALVALFVVLPVIVGATVMVVVSWRSPEVASGTRTSELLATGEPGEAEVLSMRPLGGFIDMRPMVRFLLRVRTATGDEFDLGMVQSVPRRQLPELRPGAIVSVRVTPDRANGAIVLP